MKKYLATTGLFIIPFLITSCSENTAILKKQFNALLSGNYSPYVRPSVKRSKSIEFAKLCAEKEKKQGKVPNASYTAIVYHSGVYSLTCGGFTDKCHYKIIWWYRSNGKSRKTDEYIVDMCKVKRLEEERERMLKEKGYYEFKVNPEEVDKKYGNGVY